jgi:hypothetical protein
MRMQLRFFSPILVLLGNVSLAFSQSGDMTAPPIPKSLGDQFTYDAQGVLRLSKNGQSLPVLGNTDKFTLADLTGNPTGAETGIQLDFGKPDFNGTVAYGPYVEEAQYPTITYNPKAVKIQNGRALMEMKTVFVKAADFFKFSEKGKGVVGFRVIDAAGRLLYEGRVAFTGKGPYQVVPTIIEGPLVNLVGPTSCVISFETSVPVKSGITVDGHRFQDAEPATHHEISISGLKPETAYRYDIAYGERTDSHSFQTALPEGSRKAFTFGFTADQRAVTGGGEHDLGAVNYSAARASMAAAVLNHAVFMQTMGGNTTGNNTSIGGHLLEHANWKRALEPFWSHIPVYVGMGNHEGNYYYFAPDKTTGKGTRIGRFPYETDSGEAIFARAFVLPENGPESEDGANYDPDPARQDFPPYKENVYYYTYGNLAMIVLNSEYWKSADPKVNGAPEGYVMDQQMKWLDQTIQKLEADPKIDHIFVNLHSCVFPNGDHTDAGMWYEGSNDARPRVAGVRLEKGIIERRDELIDVSINRSKKVIGFLVGSEHNFALLKVTPTLSIYPKDYSLPKLKIKRDFFYINSGGGGTYAYALLYNTPWADQFKYFTVPPTLSLFTVSGKSVTMRVLNPETFETVCDNVKLR